MSEMPTNLKNLLTLMLIFITIVPQMITKYIRVLLLNQA